MEFTCTTVGTLLLLVIYSSSTVAYPDGAPSKACSSMVPKHPKNENTGAPPYVIKLNQTAYNPGDTISGTFSNTKNAEYKGFLIQARVPGSSTLYGTFTSLDDHQHTVCGTDKKQGLTQSKSLKVTSTKFQWTAPDSSVGNLQFRLTIVEKYKPSQYWLNINSSVVYDCAINTSLSQCDSAPSTLLNMSPQATGALKFRHEPSCGVTKGCFPACDGGCNHVVTWEHNPRNSGYMRFSIKMALDNTQKSWVSLVLAQAGALENMDVSHAAVCMSHGAAHVGLVSPSRASTDQQYLNHLGISNMTSRVSGDVLECSFDRQKTMSANNVLDLSFAHYLHVATGSLSNGAGQGRVDTLTSSQDRIYFLAPPASQNTSPGDTILEPMLIIRTV